MREVDVVWIVDSLQQIMDTQAALVEMVAKKPGMGGARGPERARLGALARTANKYGLGRFEWVAVCDLYGLDPKRTDYPKAWVAARVHEMVVAGKIANDEYVHAMDAEGRASDFELIPNPSRKRK